MKKMIVALAMTAVILMGCNSQEMVLDQKCVEIQKARGSAESQIKSICSRPAE